MAIQQPLPNDPLNIPDHALSHRVFANDDSAPAQSIIVDASGNVKADKLVIYIETPAGDINGINRDYTTLHPIHTVVLLTMNGEFKHPTDYTISGGSGFSFVNPPDSSYSGLPFTIVYL